MKSKDKQKVTVSAGKGNDTYNIYNRNSTLIVSDGGGADVMNISGLSKSNTVMFFNVDKKGNTEKNLHILSKEYNSGATLKKSHKLQDTATIQNYISSNKSAGTGYIETVNASGSSCSINISSVASQVASWLSSGGRHYGSAMDVIKSKNETDINALLQMYAAK